jgi:hypothetical protein
MDGREDRINFVDPEAGAAARRHMVEHAVLKAKPLVLAGQICLRRC